MNKKAIYPYTMPYFTFFSYNKELRSIIFSLQKKYKWLYIININAILEKFSMKSHFSICQIKKKVYLCTAKIAIGSWCSGNTADFGSVIRGSSPCEPTKKTDFITKSVFLCLFRKQTSFF